MEKGERIQEGGVKEEEKVQEREGGRRDRVEVVVGEARIPMGVRAINGGQNPGVASNVERQTIYR